MFLLFFCSNLFSQLSLGIHTGLVRSTAKVNEAASSIIDPEAKSTFFAGLSLKKSFNDRLHLIGDIEFITKGFINKAFLVDDDFKLEYLEVAPELNFKINDFLYAGAGPYFSFLLNDSNFTSSSDAGLSGSVRGIFNKLYLKVTCRLGLVDQSDITFTNENGQPVGEVEQFNRSIAVGVGYFFSLRKK